MENVEEPGTVSGEIHAAIRHTAIYGLGNVAIKALGFFMLPFYTHYLNPTDYGILEILDLSMALFGMLLNMGLTPAFLRCYAAAKSPEDKLTVISTGCLFGVVTGVFVFLLGIGLVRPVSGLIFGPKVASTYVLLSFSSLVLSYMANLPRTYLRALEASGTYVVVDTATVLLLLILNVFFIAVLKLGLVGILLSSVVVGVLQLLLLGAWAFYKVQVRFDRRPLEQMLRFGAPLIFANLGLFVLNFSDRFFLKHYQSLEVVGIYAVGYKFGFMMNYLFVQPFFVMWQSRLYIVHAQPQHPKIFRQLFMFYSLLLTFAGLTMSILSPEIVRIMVGPRFSASQNVVPVIVLSYIFYGLGDFAQLGMMLTNKTNWVGVIGAGAAGLNLALNYFLISRFGMMGAAWATLISFAMIAGANYLCSRRVLQLSLEARRILPPMALGVALFLLSLDVHMSSVAAALLVKLLILAAFPILVWKTRLLASSEVETIVFAKDRFVLRMSQYLGFGSAKISR